MSFTYVKNYKENKGKFYLHKSGEEIHLQHKIFDDFLEYGIKAPEEARKGDYFISILWGDSDKNKLVDMFVYSDLKENWESNPDVSSWFIKNGVWTKENPLTCGEGIILLGEEEKLRRKTKCLDIYLQMNVDLKKLNKSLEF